VLRVSPSLRLRALAVAPAHLAPNLTRRGAPISKPKARDYAKLWSKEASCEVPQSKTRDILTSWADWVESIAPWAYFVTGTFERPSGQPYSYVGRQAGRAHVSSFLWRLQAPHAFAAEETHKDGAAHYHLLLPEVSDHATEYANPEYGRYRISVQWRHGRGGFTSVSRVTPGAIRYAAKYVSKEGGWFKLF